jgi:hypothetical protein
MISVSETTTRVLRLSHCRVIHTHGEMRCPVDMFAVHRDENLEALMGRISSARFLVVHRCVINAEAKLGVVGRSPGSAL